MRRENQWKDSLQRTLNRRDTEFGGAVVLSRLDIVRSSLRERMEEADGGGNSSIDSISHVDEAGDGCWCLEEPNILIGTILIYKWIEVSFIDQYNCKKK